MKRIVRWGVPILAVLIGILYVGISYVVASGVTKAERKEQEDHPSSYGLEYEDVEFVSRRGDVKLSGWFIPGHSTGPTLIFVHGIGSIRTGDNATDLAARLVGRGFSVLMFDLRAHGSSEGDKVFGGQYERQDVLGAFDYLVGRGVAPSRIGVLANSMGAGASVLALSDEPAIRALVADSSYASASDLIAHEISRKTIIPKWVAPVFVPGAKFLASLFFDIDVGALVPEKAVADLDYPILIVHGTADTRIPVDHGVRLHMASHPESVLWMVADVDHVDAFITYPEQYVEKVASYFNARLSGQ